MNTASLKEEMHTTSTVSPSSVAKPKQPLDQVMLAMDVVDTLRRRERLIQHELDVEGREEELKFRLKKIYSAQGIDVSDSVIDDGVKALREDRFVYTPPPNGLKVSLAHWYVSRDQWGKWVIGALAALAIAAILYFFLVISPHRALPEQLENTGLNVTELAATESLRQQAQALMKRGQTALNNDDTNAARDVLTQLETLQYVLKQEYTLRIVNEPGARSGVWRVPDVNSQARNYYIIVQALDARGNPVTVPIVNEESGKTEMVNRWGLRVDESTFQHIARDKQDDGIIEQNTFGVKRHGFIEPDYGIATSGGAITEW